VVLFFYVHGQDLYALARFLSGPSRSVWGRALAVLPCARSCDSLRVCTGIRGVVRKGVVAVLGVRAVVVRGVTLTFQAVEGVVAVHIIVVVVLGVILLTMWRACAW
jgi:hypothetical protein